MRDDRRRLRDKAITVLGPAALLGVALFEIFVRPLDTWDFTGPRSAHIGFALLVTVPLLARRRSPLLVLAIVAGGAHAWAYSMFGPQEQAPIVPFLAVLLAIYTAAEHSSGRRVLMAAALVVATAAADVPGLLSGRPVQNTLPVWVFMAGAFAVGRIVHRRAQLLEQLRETALALDRERDARLGQAVAEERTRIARELHDVITHNVSGMVVRASVQARLTHDDDGAAAFRDLEATGRATLVELRHLLGLLRRATDDADLAPQPSLRNLDALLTATRAAGLELDLDLDGDLDALPVGVDLTAYRILQEALTNVRRHARASRVEVAVTRDERELRVTVIDDGSGHVNGTGEGHGLVGMRERIALHGGDISVGAGQERGWHVAARLPLGTSS